MHERKMTLKVQERIKWFKNYCMRAWLNVVCYILTMASNIEYIYAKSGPAYDFESKNITCI